MHLLAHTVIALITRFNIARHGCTASVTQGSRDKRCVAPTRAAKTAFIGKLRTASQTLWRVNRVKQCLNPARDRNMRGFMQTPPLLTDRDALDRQRSRASDRFLFDIARDELLDRIAMVNRTFTAPLVVAPFADSVIDGAKQIADTDTLDAAEGAHDLAIHLMALHWANDPVGQIIQMRRALRADGLFQAVMLGGQTLHELRACLAQAETEITGGLSPRILPMGDIRDLGGLLQRAGLALPVADCLTIRTSYADAYALMHDLRKFGETNALAQRLRTPTQRAVFERCNTLYLQNFAEDGKVIASFEFLFLSGWAPDDSQPKPLRPGSATQRLAEALKTSETPLRD